MGERSRDEELYFYCRAANSGFGISEVKPTGGLGGSWVILSEATSSKLCAAMKMDFGAANLLSPY